METVLTSESLNQIPWCDHSKKISSRVHYFGDVCPSESKVTMTLSQIDEP